MHNIPDASIIIPVSRDSESLSRCLSSLAASTYQNFEVLLVGDNADNRIPTTHPGVRWIQTKETSPSRKRNLAVQSARALVLCFIDDDVSVTANWLSTILEILNNNSLQIIGGPNNDQRLDFRYRLASEIQAHPLLEGLRSHRTAMPDAVTVGIHDLPLCNIAMTRSVFDTVGGFNEEISYFLDDVEFNYIAERKGFSLCLYESLRVQHDIRPMFRSYFSYKFRTRREIGRVFPLYWKLYIDSAQIWAVLASYLIIPLMLTLCANTTILSLLAFYFALLIYFSLSALRKATYFILLPGCVFLTHVAMYLGFTIGLVEGLLRLNKDKTLKAQRDLRLNS